MEKNNDVTTKIRSNKYAFVQWFNDWMDTYRLTPNQAAKALGATPLRIHMYASGMFRFTAMRETTVIEKIETMPMTPSSVYTPRPAAAGCLGSLGCVQVLGFSCSHCFQKTKMTKRMKETKTTNERTAKMTNWNDRVTRFPKERFK